MLLCKWITLGLVRQAYKEGLDCTHCDNETLLAVLVQWSQLPIPATVFVEWREGNPSIFLLPVCSAWDVGSLCQPADGLWISNALQMPLHAPAEGIAQL